MQVPILETDADNGTITFEDEDGERITQSVTGGKVKAQWNYDPEDLDLEEDIEDLKVISKLDLKMNPEGGETRYKKWSES